jgi:hypothetical protein
MCGCVLSAYIINELIKWFGNIKEMR